MGSVVRLLFVALVAAGCALVPSPADVGPLVTVEAHGGLCPEGECRSVVAIGADGHVHRLEPDEAEIRRLSAETIDAIRAAMLVTDFDAIRSRPFTGELPDRIRRPGADLHLLDAPRPGADCLLRGGARRGSPPVQCGRGGAWANVIPTSGM